MFNSNERKDNFFPTHISNANHLAGLDLHIFMQTNYRLERNKIMKKTMSSGNFMTMMAVASSLNTSSFENSISRQSDYVRPSGATTVSKKKRRSQSKARKANQKQRKKK
tara:strand:+ start:346 stop:672 length:327 start_codon:yes stop_codon:yes gene_type:complete